MRKAYLIKRKRVKKFARKPILIYTYQSWETIWSVQAYVFCLSDMEKQTGTGMADSKAGVICRSTREGKTRRMPWL